jgi:uncharacterized protein YbdZ (MbtH family)/acyl carrier protein
MAESFKVVVNHEEQYSIWSEDRQNPPGWRDVGVGGPKEECLDYLREVWAASTEPRGEIEEVVARMCAELLGLDRVGIHDSFFELGGHSLRGVELVARVYDVFKVDIPLEVFFEQPTVAAVAREIAWHQQVG